MTRALVYSAIFSLLFFAGSFGLANYVSADQSFQFPHIGIISQKFSSFHPGIDLASKLGEPVQPVESGIVTKTGFTKPGLGTSVEIAHPDGFTSVYGHMSKVTVFEGQNVSKSDVLGYVGLTGNTTGPHTHLEVYKNGEAVNPLAMIDQTVTLASANLSTVLPQGGGAPGVVVNDEELPRTGPKQISQLPKTGLPLLGIALASLLPGGFGLRKLKGKKSADGTGANHIWNQRTFRKTV